MSGDDLTISLFWVGLAVTLIVSAASLAGWKHKALIYGLFAIGFFSLGLGAAWPWIKNESLLLHDWTQKIAESPVSWFCVTLFGLGVLTLRGPSARQSITNSDSVGAEPASARLPVIEITAVVFDPNGITEMYIDFVLRNPGVPATFSDWSLTVTQNRVAPSVFFPRSIQTNMPGVDAFGRLSPDNMAERPVEQGGRRTGRMVFTIEGTPPKERFGAKATRFLLEGKDVSGNHVSARYEIS